MNELLTQLEQNLQPLQPAMDSIPGLYTMFRNCFMNTAETTLKVAKPGDTYIITGDIDAMWLRDSTAQVLHYVRFAHHKAVHSLLLGLVARQMRYICIDPYANAFNQENNGRKWSNDLPAHSGYVWERKFEIDSLCYPLMLARRVYDAVPCTEMFTESFREALYTIVGVFETEQHHASSPYRFIRPNSEPGDSLTHEGRGTPVADNGLIFSGFRPSDDACTYGYLIPANLFALKALKQIVFFADLLHEDALICRAQTVIQKVRTGLLACATITHPVHGEIYAYETNGLGDYLLMDDANVPSLLSLPYLDILPADDPLYQRTRAFVLSSDNPYYFTGTYAKGVGSPHTPNGYIWPISLCVQALTATSPAEKAELVVMLLRTHAGTGLMHEGFHPDHPEEFTRPWFAWANSLFGDLLYRLHEQGELSAILTLASRHMEDSCK